MDWQPGCGITSGRASLDLTDQKVEIFSRGLGTYGKAGQPPALNRHTAEMTRWAPDSLVNSSTPQPPFKKACRSSEFRVQHPRTRPAFETHRGRRYTVCVSFVLCFHVLFPHVVVACRRAERGWLTRATVHLHSQASHYLRASPSLGLLGYKTDSAALLLVHLPLNVPSRYFAFPLRFPSHSLFTCKPCYRLCLTAQHFFALG